MKIVVVKWDIFLRYVYDDKTLVNMEDVGYEES